MGKFVLAAGGTGGHLFPATALAGELIRRGHEIVVMTDARGISFAESFGDVSVVVVPSAAVSGHSVIKLALAPFKIFAGCVISAIRLRKIRPAGVVGFGGYPSVPIMLAAYALHLPTAIVSPDALLGRANRLVMNRVKKIAANFPLTRFLPKDMSKVVYTGNPLRPEVINAAGTPYETPEAGGEFRLLVFGGSQGARFFSDAVPAAVSRLPVELRRRLRIVQQCRPEDLDRVRSAYEAMGVRAELNHFYADMPARMAAAHLVIARSGAGTVSELGAIGRPAILVPLPYALDDNQTPNAEALVHADGGWRVPQGELTPKRLADMLTHALHHPDGLARRALAVRSLARLDATAALADLVESLEVQR